MSALDVVGHLLLLASAGVSSAHAADDDGLEARTSGELRYILSLPPRIALDADGTEAGQDLVLDQRFRPRGELSWGPLTAATEWDLFTGQIAGDTWDLGAEDERGRDAIDGFSTFRARELWVQADASVFLVRAGLQTSNWGLGMVANDGKGEPLFGRTDFGDRVLRVRFTTMPFSAPDAVPDTPSPTGRASLPGTAPAPSQRPIYLSFGADRVLADDTAKLVLDQDAWQGFASVLYAEPGGKKLGTYVVYRHQTETAGRLHDAATDAETPAVVELDQQVLATTQALVGDVYGAVPLSTAGWDLDLAAEVVGIYGSTDLVRTYNAPDGVGLRSGGIALQLDAVPQSSPDLTLHGRAGVASGDSDPADDRSTVMTFDRDFQVGSVLFDEVQGAINAQTYNHITDPENSGLPPDGAHRIVDEGAVSNAVYLQPAVTWAAVDGLTIRTGMVVAFSSTPIANGFTSYRAGGVPSNHLGEPTVDRLLGTEWDWLIRWDGGEAAAAAQLRWDVALQGGHAWLGPDNGAVRADLLMGSARLLW